MGMMSEFREFAVKGNVIDLAVGVIIGGAFGKIVDSLVKHIIMPTVSVILPGKNEYADWAFHVKDQSIPYGLFLAEVVNFLLLAAVLFFFVVKFLGWMIKSKKAEAIAPPPPTRQEQLLTEIRDLLQRNAAAADGPQA